MSIFSLKYPELISVEDDRGVRTVGCDQLWYPKEGHIPQGACGAAVASNLLSYLLRSRPELYSRAERAGLTGLSAPLTETVNTKKGFIEFMIKVYPFLHPRAGGLMSDAFIDSIEEFGREYGLSVSAERLKVPVMHSKRPSPEKAADFIRTSFEEDSPVAVLSLSAGRERELENWHWVTMIEYDEESHLATIVNNCSVFRADLVSWFDSSIMGGSLVRLTYRPEEGA